MPVNERLCGESVELLMRRARQTKIRDQDPGSFVAMLNNYHRAANAARESGLSVLERTARYRLGHIYARLSLYDDYKARRMERDIRRRWENSPICAIPKDLDLSPAGLLQHGIEHFEQAAARPSPARLRYFANLYIVALLQRQRRQGSPDDVSLLRRMERSWGAAIEVFTKADFQDQLRPDPEGTQGERPDLALYTPLDLLRYAFDLEGSRLDRRMTDLALRDPYFVAEPMQGEWRLLTSPTWMAPLYKHDGVKREEGEQRVEVVFDDYAAASDFLDELRQAEPEAMFFELHPPGTSNRVESFRLPRRAEGTTYTDVLAREYSSLSENQAALLAAMVEAQHLPTAALRRRQVIERVWPDRKRTGRPRDIRNSLQNLENQVRGRVGPMPVLFAAALAEERAKHENLDAQVETNPRQAARQGGRVYDAPRPGVNQDEPRNAAVEQACFMHVNGRPEDTLLLRDGVKVFGIVHWPTFTNREGLEPLDE